MEALEAILYPTGETEGSGRARAQEHKRMDGTGAYIEEHPTFPGFQRPFPICTEDTPLTPPACTH